MCAVRKKGACSAFKCVLSTLPLLTWYMGTDFLWCENGIVAPWLMC